jgi:hypothetical protein
VSAANTNINGQNLATSLALNLGSSQVLTPGVYLVSGASTFTGTTTLDGGSDPKACFIFKLDGAFATAASSIVVLSNGTQACNVFWRIDGATAIATNSIWKGTLIVNGATALATGCNLEGRLLSISGATDVSSFTGGLSHTNFFYSTGKHRFKYSFY